MLSPAQVESCFRLIKLNILTRGRCCSNIYIIVHKKTHCFFFYLARAFEAHLASLSPALESSHTHTSLVVPLSPAARRSEVLLSVLWAEVLVRCAAVSPDVQRPAVEGAVPRDELCARRFEVGHRPVSTLTLFG